MRRQRQSSESTSTITSALNGTVKHIDLETDGYTSFVDYVDNHRAEIMNKIEQNRPNETYKVQFGGYIEFEDINGERREWYTSNKAEGDFDLNNAAEKMDEKIAVYSTLGSGWAVSNIKRIFLCLTKLSHFCRRGGHAYIKTPDHLLKKRCTVNVLNNDNKCFLYSILAVLEYDELNNHRNRSVNYDISKFEYDEADFPMKLCDIPKFERQNKLRINVLKYNNIKINKSKEVDVMRNPFFDLYYKTKCNEDWTVVNLLIGK